jgi:hypothetical protein
MMALKSVSPRRAAAEKVFGVPNWRKPPSKARKGLRHYYQEYDLSLVIA